MNDATTYADMTFETPTVEAARARFEAIARQFDEAQGLAGRLAAIEAWKELSDRHVTWDSLVDLRFHQDTENAEFKRALEHKDELSPKLQELEVGFKAKLLAHPDRAELERELGSQAFALWDADARSFSPAVQDDLVAESKLTNEYVELLASARLPVRGEALTLSTIGKYLTDADRSLREEANQARWSWFAANRAELDRLYDELTRLRHGMARKLGLADYVELGYLLMQRVDYDKRDVERLRAQIRDEVVPLYRELREQQARDLGVDALRYWDEDVLDRAGNPKPKGDHDWMIVQASEMFDEMGSGLGEFFRLMNERGLLDLKSRDGKAGGGFCTSMPAYGVPFVFANFNGTQGDVEVFTHEIGHAFQAYQARGQRLPDYYWPTYESAEIHSMSLEFLTWPWMDRFFGEDAERFRRVHLTQSILFLCYGTAIDHFQHLVYERPDATPAERFEMWQEMERTYLPGRDYGGQPHVTDGGFWQRQQHVYTSPFYYIDYVLAQICALQFWERAGRDREAAMRDYVALCKRGGEAPFQDLARGAGLVSPFDDGCLSSVVAKARDYLR